MEAKKECLSCTMLGISRSFKEHKYRFTDFKRIRIFFTRKSRISVFMRNVRRNSIYSRGVEKLIVSQLVNRYPVVPGIRWLITFFTGTDYWTLSCAS